MQFTAILREARSVALLSWYALLFLQPFSHFGALRLLFGLLLFFALAWVLLSDGRKCFARLSVPYVGAALVIWILLVSGFGPYPMDSLNAVRKDLIVQILMFLAGLVLVRSLSGIWQAIIVALAGFAALTCLSWVEVVQYWWANGLSFHVYRDHKSFLGGYGATGSFYMPLLLGVALKANIKTFWRWTLLGLAGAAGFLVFLYGSRTPLIVMLLTVSILLMMLRCWRPLFAVLGVAVLLVGIIQVSNIGVLERYRSLMQGETYVTNAGLSQRFSVWEGCMDLIQERPFTGFGYGWKKLAWAINDLGYAEKWRTTKPPVAAYYLTNGQASYGRVNPHSYILQVAFEIGVVGLALVLVFWGLVLRGGLLLVKHADIPLKDPAIVILATFLGYALANITNGHWVGGLANISLALVGCLLTLLRLYGQR